MHYPGACVHGGYDRETTILGGQPVRNEDLVDLPDWLILQLGIEGEDAIGLAEVELPGYRHEPDIRYATAVRHLRFRDRGGSKTTLHTRQLVSMADRHHAGIHVRGGVPSFDPLFQSRLDAPSFSAQFWEAPNQGTLTGDRPTLAVHREGVSRPIRVAVRDEVRELCPGQRTVFELSQNPATTGPSARE